MELSRGLYIEQKLEIRLDETYFTPISDEIYGISLQKEV